jgi:Tfp pilus assembly protein PilF
VDGRYRLIRRIGEGGRGVVYEGRHEEMGRSVAIKLLAPAAAADAQGLERFRREARAAGRLNHPNVVMVHDFKVGSGRDAHLVMELCDESLADELARDGRSSSARVCEVIEAVASAVSAAHGAGIVHRDLKPANILLCGGRVKVADFGLATLAEDDPSPGLTGDHAVGSPHYMSPEQAAGKTADARSDVYGLGIIAYEMLTGFVPFTGGSWMSVLMKHLSDPPRAPSSVDAAIPVGASRAVLRALEKDPDRRFQTATEFARALVAALRLEEHVPAANAKVETKPVRPVTMLDVQEEETSLIGREAPLAVMNRRLLEALRGHGGFVLISGEPGAGKTTLAQAFLTREVAARPEILAAVGHCSERFGAGEAYLPFLEIAGRLAQGLEDGRAVGFLRTLAPTWCRHLPAIARDLADERRGSGPLPTLDRMPRELTDFLSALTTVRPTVLVLEDLHWADSSSVDLLAYLARRIGEMRLLVIATYRPSDIEVVKHPLRQALRGLSSSSSVSAEIAPSPFSKDEVGAFLERELGAQVAEDVIAFVHARTEGNPLFVLNLLRHLNGIGAIRVEEGRAVAARPLETLSGEVPEGIVGVIVSRLESLDELDRRILQMASVQGESFDSAAVAASLGADELEVEDRLDRLHRAHRLVDHASGPDVQESWLTARYRFVHAYYQAALYGSIPPRRRAAWHAALAAFLLARAGENTDGIASTLAVHFEKAQDAPKAIWALERAAETVSRRNPREARPLLDRAVTLAGRLPSESRVAERARLLTRVGRHASETAELAGDASLYANAESAVSEALRLDPEGPHSAEALTTLGLVHLERGENERALSDLVDVIARWPAHAAAHNALAYLYKNTGYWERSLAAQRAAAALDPALAHSIPRLSVHLYRDELAAAHAEADALLAVRPDYSHYTYWKGIVFYYAGQLDEARRWIERGYQLDPDNFIAKGVLAFILAHHGDHADARRHLAVAERGAAADGTFTYWIAKVKAALGEADEALAWIARAEAIGYWNAPWVRRDRALDAVRGHAGFEERVASMQEKHRAFGLVAEATSSR